MSDLVHLLRRDAARWVAPGEVADPDSISWRTILALLHRHQSLRAVALYRLGHHLRHLGVRGSVTTMQRIILRRYGLEIAGEIGGGLYIAHPVGTVIAVERMGTNCSVIAAVTIGMRNEWSFPVIGDDVFIGAGARVLGAITVGDQVKVGANSVVIDDVPAGVTVVGAPARPIPGSAPTSSSHDRPPGATVTGS